LADEKTLVLIKPDGVLKGVIKEIRQRYLDNDLVIVREEQMTLEGWQVEKFYEEHLGKYFFEALTLAMGSGPCVAIVFQGENAIEKVRKLNGATDPKEAEPGTIRRDFRSAGGPFNTVHGSDSTESADREIDIIWGEEEIPF